MVHDTGLPSLGDLADWVRRPDRFTGAPRGSAVDDALNRADESQREKQWLDASEQLEILCRKRPLDDATQAKVSDIAKGAFLRAFEAAGAHHDFAAHVSDDFEMIATASALGTHVPFIEALWRAYESGSIPVGIEVETPE